MKRGEIACLIGAKGAGKTTLFRSLAGLIKPTAGAVTFDGRPRRGGCARSCVSAGLTLVPEGGGSLRACLVRDMCCERPACSSSKWDWCRMRRPFSADMPLTPVETQVLGLIARGLDNAAIAARLGKSEKTVRNQVSSILGKLRVRTRAKAIALARDAGIGGPV